MIIKVIKRNPLGMKQEVNMLSALFGKERVELMPAEMEIWIDTERIEMMVPPVGKEPDGGCFPIKYAGKIIFIKDNCYEELLSAWEKSKKTNEETDEKYNELLRQYQEIIELEKENKKSCQCESDKKGTPDPEFPTAKRMGDNRPVTERIRNMNDVLAELGPDHPLVSQYRHYLESTEPGQRDDYLATFMQLRIVTEAINEGWRPNLKETRCYYVPLIYIYNTLEEANRRKVKDEIVVEIPENVGWVTVGLTTESLIVNYTNAASHGGSRLCFKTEELAMHAAKTFPELWIKFYFM